MEINGIETNEQIRYDSLNLSPELLSALTKKGYEIATPTQADWDSVAKVYPMSTPEMKAVRNMNAKEWAEAGIGESDPW